MLRLLEDKIATPLGPLWVIADEQFCLRAVEWEEHSDRMEDLLDIHYRSQGYERISATNPGGLSDKLAAYFEGDLSSIDPLPRSSAKCGKRCGLSRADRSCIMASSRSS